MSAWADQGTIQYSVWIGSVSVEFSKSEHNMLSDQKFIRFEIKRHAEALPFSTLTFFSSDCIFMHIKRHKIVNAEVNVTPINFIIP